MSHLKAEVTTNLKFLCGIQRDLIDNDLRHKAIEKSQNNVLKILEADSCINPLLIDYDSVDPKENFATYIMVIFFLTTLLINCLMHERLVWKK